MNHRTPRPPPPRSAGVASPCISVCRMHAATGWCEGCLRTLAEIASWGSAADAERLAILAELPARRVAWARLQAAALPVGPLGPVEPVPGTAGS